METCPTTNTFPIPGNQGRSRFLHPKAIYNMRPDICVINSLPYCLGERIGERIGDLDPPLDERELFRDTSIGLMKFPLAVDLDFPFSRRGASFSLSSVKSFKPTFSSSSYERMSPSLSLRP